MVPSLHPLSPPAFFQLICHRRGLASWTVLLLHLSCTLQLLLPTVRPCASTTSYPHPPPKVTQPGDHTDVQTSPRPPFHLPPHLPTISAAWQRLASHSPCPGQAARLCESCYLIGKCSSQTESAYQHPEPRYNATPSCHLQPSTWTFQLNDPSLQHGSREPSSHSALQAALPSNPSLCVRGGTGHKT